MHRGGAGLTVGGRAPLRSGAEAVAEGGQADSVLDFVVDQVEDDPVG
jgi:hypothetical protein